MNLSLLSKKNAETSEMSFIQRCEAILPIYQQYKRRKQYLQYQINALRSYNTDNPCPMISMNYASYLTHEKFLAAVKKRNEERAAANQRSIERYQKELKNLEQQTEANLSQFFGL